MFSRISLRTLLSQPGRATGRFLQDEPDGGRQGGGGHRTSPGAHLRLNGPRAVNDEAGPDQGGDQRLPGIGLLVGEHDHEPPVRPQRSVTRAEQTGHAVFIVLLGPLSVSVKSAGVVYELAVTGVMIPFGAKGIGEKTDSISADNPGIERLSQT